MSLFDLLSPRLAKSRRIRACALGLVAIFTLPLVASASPSASVPGASPTPDRVDAPVPTPTASERDAASASAPPPAASPAPGPPAIVPPAPASTAVSSTAAQAAAAISYEQQLVDRALQRVAAAPVPAPDGKTIESIQVEVGEVVIDLDPWPDLANVLHRTTVEEVIRRELVLIEGQAFSAERALESERNLRRLGLFSVARVIPVEGATPERVRLLVVTKDLWSLRLNWDFKYAGNVLQSLSAEFVERNVAGHGKRLGVETTLRQDSIALSQSYLDARVWGRKLRLYETATLLLDPASGSVDGTRGQVELQRPLYTLADTWGFSSEVAWRHQPVRIYQGASIRRLPYPDSASPAAWVPFAYRARELGAGGSVVRSFGSSFKTDLSAGAGAYSRQYLPGDKPGPLTPEALWLQTRWLPHDEDAVYLSTSVRAFEARYTVLRDVDTFGLSEDFQLGPSALWRTRFAPPLAPALAGFVESGATLRYRILAAGDLVTARAAGAIRWEPGAPARSVRLTTPWVNRRLAFEVSNVTPVVARLGRLVTRASFESIAADHSRTILFLGGANGLRGVKPEALAGTGRGLLNVEWRTRGLELRTVRLGGVLFFDAGGTSFARGDSFTAIGAGLRILLPQFNVVPIRLDAGYVLSGPPTPFLEALSASFGQVTDESPTLLDDPL